MTKIILILVLILAIIAGVYLATSETSFFGRADESPFPGNVLITNIKPDSFTVSYFTNKPARTLVNWGENNTVPNSALDARGDLGNTNAHYVNLSGLNPDTEYFIKAGNSDNLFKVKTAKTLSGDVPNGKGYKGIAVSAQNQPAKDSILYFRVTDQGQLLSVPVSSDGNFTINTQGYRNKTLDGYPQINIFDKLEFLVESGNGGLGYLISFAGNNRSVKVLVEQNYVPFFKIQQGPAGETEDGSLVPEFFWSR